MTIIGFFYLRRNGEYEYIALRPEFGEEGQAVLATQTEHNSVLRPLMNQTVKDTHPVWIVPCGKDGQ